MQNIEKIGTPKDVWIQCPGCMKLYYIDRLFYDPSFAHIKLHCPFCHLDFAKEDAPMTWG